MLRIGPATDIVKAVKETSKSVAWPRFFFILIQEGLFPLSSLQQDANACCSRTTILSAELLKLVGATGGFGHFFHQSSMRIVALDWQCMTSY